MNLSSNSNQDCPEESAIVIDRTDLADSILLPCIAIFGMVGNLFSVIIFHQTRKLRRLASSVYLISLALSDSIFLSTLLLSMPVSSLLEHPAICKTVFYFMNVSGVFSSWVVVLFTVERFIVIAYPLTPMAKCSRRRAINRVLSILPFPCLMYIYTALVLIDVDPDTLRCQPNSDYLFTITILHSIDISITYFIPAFTVVSLNISIGLKLADSNIRRRELRSGSGSSDLPVSIAYEPITRNTPVQIRRSFGGKNGESFGGKNGESYGGNNEGSFGGKNGASFGGKIARSFGGKNEGCFGGNNEGSFGGKNGVSFGGKIARSFGGKTERNPSCRSQRSLLSMGSEKRRIIRIVNNTNSSHSTSSSENAITRTLIVISTTFAFLNLPHNLILLVKLYGQMTSIGECWTRGDFMYIFTSICYALYYANFGVNIVVYHLTSSNYRDGVKGMLKRVRVYVYLLTRRKIRRTRLDSDSGQTRRTESMGKMRWDRKCELRSEGKRSLTTLVSVKRVGSENLGLPIAMT